MWITAWKLILEIVQWGDEIFETIKLNEQEILEWFECEQIQHEWLAKPPKAFNRTHDEVSTIPSSKACNSALSTIEYRARAADEAQRTITICYNCPLDASKLSISSVPRQPHMHLPRFTRSRSTKSTSHSSSTDYIQMLYAKIHLVYVPQNTHTASCTDLLDENGILYRLYHTGPYSNTCVSETSRRLVGPYISHMTLSVANATSESAGTYAHFQYCELISGNYMVCHNGTDWYITIRLNSSCNDSIEHHMRMLYNRYITLHSLESFVARSLLGSMFNLSELPGLRAWLAKAVAIGLWFNTFGIMMSHCLR